jgi:uncharacterized membrane protein
MTPASFLKLYVVGAIVYVGLDALWLGVLARGFYQRHLGPIMKPHATWAPAIVFYLVYVVALIVFVVGPALERGSLVRAIGLGAFLGFVVYAAYDFTSLTVIRGFPVVAGLVDQAWGTARAAIACGTN